MIPLKKGIKMSYELTKLNDRLTATEKLISQGIMVAQMTVVLENIRAEIARISSEPVVDEIVEKTARQYVKREAVKISKPEQIREAAKVTEMFSRSNIDTSREFCFCIHKNDLHQHTNKLYSLVKKDKTSIFVRRLFCITASVDDQSFTLTTADGTSAVCSAAVNQDAKIFLPSELFAMVIKEIQNDWLYMSIVGEHLRIECQKTIFNLSLVKVDVGNLYTRSESSLENEIVVNSLLFKKALQDTIFAVVTSSVRSDYTICQGVYFTIDGDMLTMAATDTRKISENKVPIISASDVPMEIVLPKNDLDYIVKMITSDGDLIIRYSSETNDPNASKQIEIVFGDSIAKTECMTGRYPTYTVAFRNKPDRYVKANIRELKKLLQQVSKLSEDDDKLVKFTFREDSLFLESMISERGTSINSLPVSTNLFTTGEEFVLYLNAKFILSILSHINTTCVQFGILDDKSPVWMLPCDVDSKIEARYIVMPMRIN
jgi:DNA polymerase III beta subunit